MADLDLKSIERRAWRSSFQDGIWDIYLGLLLAAMAVNAALSDFGMPEARIMPIFVGLEVLAILALWAGKKFITVPRVGRMKPGQKGKARQRKARLLLVASLITGLGTYLLALAVRGERPDWLNPRVFFPAVWVVNSLLVFGLGAYFLDYARLFVIGAMYAVAVPLDILLTALTGADLSWVAFAIPSSVVVAMGVVMLARFLRDYPSLAGNASLPDGNQL